MKQLPWWQALPTDFCRSSNETAIDAALVGRVKATARLDKLARLSLASGITLATLPNLLNDRRVARELEQLAFYARQVDAGNPDKVFLPPPTNIPVRSLARPLWGYQPKGIDVDLLGFDSPYVALHPDMREPYHRHARNNVTVAQHWRHGDKPRPTLIWIHGAVIDPFWVNSLMFSLRWFFHKGYDILLYTLPFHGYRTERRDLLSGMGFFSHGLPHVNEAMLQAVHDLRCWVSYLYQQGAPSVGVGGMSLGGYITALAAAAEPRLDFAIANVPVVLPVDMLMEWQPTAFVFQRMMKRQQLDLPTLRHLLAIHCPLSWQPALPADRRLIIGGAGDRFTSPRYVKQLQQHWQGSKTHWFPGNHLVHLQQGTYLRLMERFIANCTQQENRGCA